MGWGQKKAARDRPTWNQEDYHTAFAGKLTEQIRNGTAPWQKPWKPGERRLPENLHTGKAYRGGSRHGRGVRRAGVRVPDLGGEKLHRPLRGLWPGAPDRGREALDLPAPGHDERL